MGAKREPGRQPVVHCPDNTVFYSLSLDRPVLALVRFPSELRRHPATGCSVQVVES